MKKLLSLIVLTFSIAMISITPVKAEPVIGGFIAGYFTKVFADSKYNTHLRACDTAPWVWIKGPNGLTTRFSACAIK